MRPSLDRVGLVNRASPTETTEDTESDTASADALSTALLNVT
ncbi:hypothetical protein [Rummeliibacillus stabekisii]|nr:hypothetical protein [Rummeliibacillus stabekisii]